MQEYVENGVRLGWLLNRRQRQVECYGIGRSRLVLEAPLELSDETVLPESVLSLTGF